MEPKFKLIVSTSPEIFEERLNEFIDSLDKDDLIVDVKFSSAHSGSAVEYSALVHYQPTSEWEA